MFSQSYSLTTRLVLLSFLSLAFMWLDKNNYLQDYLDDTFSAIVYPIIKAVNYPYDLGRDVSKKLSAPKKMTLEQLAEENKRLRKKVLDLELAGIENKNYKKLLKARHKIREKVRLAEIIYVGLDPDIKTVKIGLGRKDCVIEGQPLVDAHGVLGQVIKSRALFSTVRLITDSNHIMHVQFRRTGRQTLAYGDGKSNMLRLPNLPLNEQINDGEEIITSGLGGVYPYGYMVGKIVKKTNRNKTKVRKDTGKQFAVAYVKPTAHINQTREGLLVWTEEMRIKAKAQSRSFGKPVKCQFIDKDAN